MGRLGWKAALAAFASNLMIASTASAGPYINVEAVNNYSACNPDSLSHPISDATGFRNQMIEGANPVGYQWGQVWINNAVWTSDFFDPERTGLGAQGDSDQLYFDKLGTAFSYFAGHGVCDTGDTEVICLNETSCVNPPAGTTYPSFCRRLPGNNFGRCSYTRYARQLAVGNCTSGPPRNGRINYSTGLVKWGESAWTGSWAGAGTSGGTNVVVLHSSCAEMSNRGQEVRAAFGGMHLMANVLVHQGDTASTNVRGFWFAFEYTPKRLQYRHCGMDECVGEHSGQPGRKSMW